jgi:hypothetical protein
MVTAEATLLQLVATSVPTEESLVAVLERLPVVAFPPTVAAAVSGAALLPPVHESTVALVARM